MKHRCGVGHVCPALQCIREHLQPTLLVPRHLERPQRTRQRDSLERTWAARVEERTLRLQEKVEPESRQANAWARKVPHIGKVIVTERGAR